MLTWVNGEPPVTPISVVIPYYNRQQFIDECLDSVFRQTLPPAEIIVVDDGSVPAQRGYLEKFRPRVRIIPLAANRGVSVARNAGIEAAGGEWIAFNDSDDVWEPTKLEKQWQHVLAHPDCDGVHSALRVFYANGSEGLSGAQAPLLTLADALHQNVIRVQTLLIRARVLRALGGFDPRLRLCEDDDLCIRLALGGYRIDFMAEPLTRMRREHGDHLLHSWRRLIAGKAAVAWHHRELLERTLGRGATRRRIAHAVRKAGHARGKIVGRLLRLGGWILGGFDARTD
jgi:glycosyltransferase involved in cell wall biosynthesis